MLHHINISVIPLLFLTVLSASITVLGAINRVIPDEQRLLNKVFRNYDHSVRPVFNATNSVMVKFGLTLIQIMDMVSRNSV